MCVQKVDLKRFVLHANVAKSAVNYPSDIQESIVMSHAVHGSSPKHKQIKIFRVAR